MLMCPSKSCRIRTHLTWYRQTRQPAAHSVPGPGEDSVLKACPLPSHPGPSCPLDIPALRAPTQPCPLRHSLPNGSCCSLVLWPKPGIAVGGDTVTPLSCHGVPWLLPLKHPSSRALQGLFRESAQGSPGIFNVSPSLGFLPQSRPLLPILHRAPEHSLRTTNHMALLPLV